MKLPPGWSTSPLGSLTTLVTSGSRGWAKYYTESGSYFVRVQNVQRGSVKLDLADAQFVSVPRDSEGERTKLQFGDILVTITADLGRIGLIDSELDAYVNQHIALVRVYDFQHAPYIAHFLRSEEAQKQLGLRDRGVTRAGLGLEDIKIVTLFVPPLAEQRRIVAKLDALTVRSARARVELARVPELVQRIKQQALAICFASEPDRAPIRLGTILQNIQAGKNLRCEERPPHPGELGVVKVSAVTWGRFDPTKAKTLPPDYIPPEAARIRAGDLLMSRANTIELVGAVALVERAPRDLFLSDKILRLVVPEDAKRWIQWFLRSPSGREQIERMATGNQFSMRNLSQDALRRIELPFPNAATRLSAIHELEASFARADRLQSEAARATKLLDRLEKSILAKAFRGELLPQDPADEPAAVLLDHIRAKRAESAARPPRRRARGGTVTTARDEAERGGAY